MWRNQILVRDVDKYDLSSLFPDVVDHSWIPLAEGKSVVCSFCGESDKEKGVKCSTCGFCCHDSCSEKVLSSCLKPSIVADDAALVGTGANHIFEKRTFALVNTSYCCNCRSQIGGVKGHGYRCRVCGYESCARCIGSTPCSCKLGYVRSDLVGASPVGGQEMKFPHVYREGHFSGEECSVCKEKIEGIGGLYGYMCIWCGRHYHPRCLHGSTSIFCDLGKYGDFTFPPTYVCENPDEAERAVLRFIYTQPKAPSYPVVVLVNTKSGLGIDVGKQLLSFFRSVLNPMQVFDVSTQGPKFALSMLYTLRQYFILVCGGDGTVSWAVNTLTKLGVKDGDYPPLSIVSTGTENDMAKTLGYPTSFNSKNMEKALNDFEEPGLIKLVDRWVVETRLHGYKSVSDDVVYMCNYLSLGLDAEITLRWIHERKRNPEKYKRGFTNKLKYGRIGVNSIFGPKSKLSQMIFLKCDGKRVQIPPSVVTISIHNIPYYSGGRFLWIKKPKKDFDTVRVDDGILEVCGTTGAINTGLIMADFQKPYRIAQCRVVELSIVGKNEIPIQIDGEAWIQVPSTISIFHDGMTPFLCNKTGFYEPQGTRSSKNESQSKKTPQAAGISAEEANVGQFESISEKVAMEEDYTTLFEYLSEGDDGTSYDDMKLGTVDISDSVLEQPLDTSDYTDSSSGTYSTRESTTESESVYSDDEIFEDDSSEAERRESLKREENENSKL